MSSGGRPSVACSPCRARRIKCDKAKPICSQCVRVGNICTGYVDPLDQLFRDENDKVVKRAQKSYQKPSKVRHGRESTNEEGNCIYSSEAAAIAVPVIPSRDEASPTLALQPCFSTQVEDIAITYLMSSFAPGSRFDYLPQIYTKSGENNALHTSVRAVSMAFLSQRVGQTVAFRCYNQAITATNAALSDPSTATEDTTLVSILLLSLFEAITWMPSRTLRSWKAHAQGALTLIKLRGTQQLDTEVGRQLFRQVSTIICVNSIQERTQLPAELVTLLRLARQKEGGLLRHHLAWLTTEVSHLMAIVTKESMTAQDAIDASRGLDEQYIAFMQRLNLEVPYRTTSFEESQREVYGLSYHIYANHYDAQMWNSARMTRLILNEAIHAHASYLEPSLAAPLQAQARHHINQMIVDICDSVPRVTTSETRVSHQRSLQPGEDGRWLSFKPSDASFLLPLSVVSQSRFTTEGLQAHAAERLKFLGGETSVSASQKVAIQTCSQEIFQNRLFMFYTL